MREVLLQRRDDLGLREPGLLRDERDQLRHLGRGPALRGHDRVLGVDDRGDHVDPGAVALHACGGRWRAAGRRAASVRCSTRGTSEMTSTSATTPDADGEHDRRARRGKPARDRASEVQHRSSRAANTITIRPTISRSGAIQSTVEVPSRLSKLPFWRLENGDQVGAEIRPQLRHGLHGRAVEAREPVDVLDVVPPVRSPSAGW